MTTVVLIGGSTGHISMRSGVTRIEASEAPAMIPIVLVYLGSFAALLAAVRFIWPLNYLPIARQSEVIAFLGLGLMITLIGLALPAREEDLSLTGRKRDAKGVGGPAHVGQRKHSPRENGGVAVPRR